MLSPDTVTATAGAGGWGLPTEYTRPVSGTCALRLSCAGEERDVGEAVARQRQVGTTLLVHRVVDGEAQAAGEEERVVDELSVPVQTLDEHVVVGEEGVVSVRVEQSSEHEEADPPRVERLLVTVSQHLERRLLPVSDSSRDGAVRGSP